MLTIPLHDRYVKALKDTYLDDRHYSWLIGGKDMDVFKSDGSPLLAYRHCFLPKRQFYNAWFNTLWGAARHSQRRGVESGTMGFYDHPLGLTTFTRTHPYSWKWVQPFLRSMNAAYRLALPDQHEWQRRVAEAADQRWIIPSTVFTTVTVNRNVRFKAHPDRNNLKGGFGVMTVLQSGEYEGCYLVFPKYRIAVDVRSQDILVADTHELHGNTPLIGVEGQYQRISVVAYFRNGFRNL